MTPTSPRPRRPRIAADLAAVACAVLAALALPADEPRPVPAAAAGEVLLVRHAEAAADGTDPDLTPAGLRRAEALAERLAGLDLDAVLATDTRRARATAEPVAAARGLEIEIYDHRRLAELAARLRAQGGTVLVVGHSNTTPELVVLLGGDPGEPIAHDEHDRLYRVDPASGRTTVERFAAAAE
jgi:broad specificity phosphatase PhoE